MSIQIHEQDAVPLTFAPRPVVDAQGVHRLAGGSDRLRERVQQGICADLLAPTVARQRAERSAGFQREGGHLQTKSPGQARPRGRHPQVFAEEAL